ncbi:hypothetical protein [Paracoccus sediminilitoris]|uniref:hypothetical protein n=1 Tax=Paracoccus sediminilitoris TaxID=2202419 RepID=UPI0011B94B6B|nr:hypothetical protein [Paracoccus sediminilitoris]
MDIHLASHDHAPNFEHAHVDRYAIVEGMDRTKRPLDFGKRLATISITTNPNTIARASVSAWPSPENPKFAKLRNISAHLLSENPAITGKVAVIR